MQPPEEETIDVSVCVATYNGAALLSHTLESLAVQTGVRLEIIVSDDCSSDATLSVAESTAARFPNCEWLIYRNEQRLGMAGNWTACVRRARGEFIKLIGQDDMLLPGCLATQVAALRANPSAMVAATTRTIINERGCQLFKVPSPFPHGITPGEIAARRSLLAGTNIIGDPVAVLFRRSGFLHFGSFNSSIVYCTDLEMWLRLLALGDLFFEETSYALYRIHQGACGPAFSRQVPADFLNTLRAVEPLFSWRISETRRHWIAFKSRLLSWLRSLIYVLVNHPVVEDWFKFIR